jgi:hypothetical protein
VNTAMSPRLNTSTIPRATRSLPSPGNNPDETGSHLPPRGFYRNDGHFS